MGYGSAIRVPSRNSALPSPQRTISEHSLSPVSTIPALLTSHALGGLSRPCTQPLAPRPARCGDLGGGPWGRWGHYAVPPPSAIAQGGRPVTEPRVQKAGAQGGAPASCPAHFRREPARSRVPSRPAPGTRAPRELSSSQKGRSKSRPHFRGRDPAVGVTGLWGERAQS